MLYGCLPKMVLTSSCVCVDRLLELNLTYICDNSQPLIIIPWGRNRAYLCHSRESGNLYNIRPGYFRNVAKDWISDQVGDDRGKRLEIISLGFILIHKQFKQTVAYVLIDYWS